ncbi:DUF6062 family protein [Thermococcus sp.]
MDMIGVYLKEAFLKEGCPVCRMLREFEGKTLATILYEHSNDPQVITDFKKSLGLCPYHAWKLFETSASNSLYDPLGVAVIYERMLAHYLESGENVKEEECPICTLVEEKERIVVDSIVKRIDEILEYYRDSPAILCRRHYRMIVEGLATKAPEKGEELKNIHKKKLKNIHELLKGFIEKSSYMYEEGPSEEEARAIRSSILILKGEPLAINQKGFVEKSSKKRGRVIFGRKN